LAATALVSGNWPSRPGICMRRSAPTPSCRRCCEASFPPPPRMPSL